MRAEYDEEIQRNFLRTLETYCFMNIHLKWLAAASMNREVDDDYADEEEEEYCTPYPAVSIDLTCKGASFILSDPIAFI